MGKAELLRSSVSMLMLVAFPSLVVGATSDFSVTCTWFVESSSETAESIGVRVSTPHSGSSRPISIENGVNEMLVELSGIHDGSRHYVQRPVPGLNVGGLTTVFEDGKAVRFQYAQNPDGQIQYVAQLGSCLVAE